MPYDADLTIELQGGRFACSKLEVRQRTGGPPVTLAGIRSIPVEKILRSVSVRRRTFIESAPQSDSLPVGGPLGLPIAPRRQRGKRRGPEDDLDLTAIVYVLASAMGEPPTQAVATQLRVPLGTARDLVARARERGILLPEDELVRKLTAKEQASPEFAPAIKTLKLKRSA